MNGATPERIADCRARVRGEEMVRDFAYCNLWKPHLTREEALRWFEPLMTRGWHDRPCASPRRHQCRSGGVQREALGVVWTEYAGKQERCEGLPW